MTKDEMITVINWLVTIAKHSRKTPIELHLFAEDERDCADCWNMGIDDANNVLDDLIDGLIATIEKSALDDLTQLEPVVVPDNQLRLID